MQRISSGLLIYDERWRKKLSFNTTPNIWRADMSGAVYAQFTTPFEIKATGLSGYSSRAFLRLPRDPHYTGPHPDRTNRGWIVLRAQAGNELFRADVNMFMDGGVGVAAEDAHQITEALVEFSARHGAGEGYPYPSDKSLLVVETVLERLEALHSPWAVISMASNLTGVECFHENAQGQRTPERFVVDLRLTRASVATYIAY